MIKNKRFVIVGAGLAGLFAARVLKSFGANKISVIEKSDNIGGLLGNISVSPIADGLTYDFDFGTHFVLSTKNSKINKLIKADLDETKFLKFKNSLLEGQYLNGKLYQYSSSPNLFHLPKNIQVRIKKELDDLLMKKPLINKYLNLNDLYTQKYGETAKKYIFLPIFKKFTNLDLKELSSIMDGSLFPNRIIIENRMGSKIKKKDPFWDSRIAYADCSDGSSEIVKYYPKDGGIGLWVKSIFNNLKDEGVNFHLKTSIVDLEIDNKNIKKICTSKEEKIYCDKVLWTLPPSFISSIANIKFPFEKPNFQLVTIVNFIFDLKPIKYPYYLNIYDSSFSSFRVTIYDNFSKNDNFKKKSRVTVEILHGKDFENKTQLKNQIFNELKLLKIISPRTKVLWSDVLDKNIAFPVFSPNSVQNNEKQIRIIEESIENINLIGRRSNIHGQIAIMENIYNTIDNFFKG